MKNIFKQLEGLVTNSNAHSFEGAVVRLTVLYTFGVGVILLLFSGTVYSLFVSSIPHDDTIVLNIDTLERLSPIAEKEQNLHEAAEHLFDILLISDLVLLVLTVFVSYLLARETLAPLAISYDKQRRFTADAAHELRTPLAVMKAGFEVLMQKDRANDAYKKSIIESQEEIDRLISLANDLLIVASNSAGHGVTKTHFSLSQVCTTQFEKMHPYAEQRGISMNAEIAPDIEMLGRKDDIARAIINLLKNAIDYNVTNGTVTFVLTQTKKVIHIKIIDSGIGIEPRDLSQVFERFYKADSSRTQKQVSGSGLGLAIVKEIVTFHGGTIHIDSEVGSGTTIEISLSAEKV